LLGCFIRLPFPRKTVYLFEEDVIVGSSHSIGSQWNVEAIESPQIDNALLACMFDWLPIRKHVVSVNVKPRL